jgi:hypothetical protein
LGRAWRLCAATRKLAQNHPELLEAPGWEGVREYLRANPPPQPDPILQQ